MSNRTTIGNLILLSAIGSCVTNDVGIKGFSDFEFSKYGQYVALESSNYSLDRGISGNNEIQQRISTLLTVAKQLTQNSENIDPEFVDIVNKNFWDLI